jgi:metal-sulfur cluster biosynthetic enzyme
MADPQNANPTILNASDLPTRRRRASSKESGPTGLGLFSYPSPMYIDDPFSQSSTSKSDADSDTDSIVEPIDEQEIYDLISTISDPEHPLSLGSLAVVSLPDISIKPTMPSRPQSNLQTATILITPTITHCSLATVIGLGVRVRLEQSLPARFRVDVRIKEGTHSTADEVNKQLADKERVAAAMENGTLMGVLKKMLETCQ